MTKPDEDNRRASPPARDGDYVLVPREPTEQMAKAGREAWWLFASTYEQGRDDPNAAFSIAYKAAIEAAPIPTPPDDGRIPDSECFWLIERKCQPPQYYGTGAGFTSDPWRAQRFKTEREAHDHWRTMTAFRDECSVVEHMFYNRLPKATPPDNTAEEAGLREAPTARAQDGGKGE